MSRQDRRSWFASQQRCRKCVGRRSTLHGSVYARRLHVEQLEDRRLLAAVTVGNHLDVVNGDTSSITSLQASDGGDGVSLREAIIATNNTGGGDTVLFDSALAGQTIAIASQLPAIADALTITGLGANLLTIDAGNGADNNFATGDGYRIFVITDGTGGLIDVEISGLTLSGGDPQRGADGNEAAGGLGANGGAIRTSENLTVIASTISGNATGQGGTGGVTFGPFLGGTLSLGYAGGNGGDGAGIFSYAGTLTVRDSTISGNRTGRGGNAGTPVASANLTRGDDGGRGGDGAGIFVTGGSVLIEQSTISGNSTGSGGVASSGNLSSGTHGVRGDGGGIASSAPTAVYFSTLTNNTANSGGGISNGAVTSVSDSIVAGNVASSSPNVAGTLASGMFNVIDVFAMLGMLADNGGPTKTHALLPGSPAINAGDPAVSSGFDQRGQPRVALGPVDIGAYELSLPDQGLVVSTTFDLVDEDFSVGQLSLREAILFANANTAPDLITFDPTVFTGGSNSLVRLMSGELEITDTLTIDGSTGVVVTITGDRDDDDITDEVNISDVDASGASRLDDNSRVFHFSSISGDLTFSGIALTGGRTTGNNMNLGGGQGFETNYNGGGVRFLSSGTLTLSDSTLSGNSTAGDSTYGGGVFTSNGDLTLTGSQVSGNFSQFRGGGVATSSGSVMLTSSTVSGNTSFFNKGGGIFTSAGNVTLTSSTVSDNASRNNGGGIYTNFGSVKLVGSTVSGNSSTSGSSDGGGIYTGSGSVTLTSSTVGGNSSGFRGGGISTNSGSVILTGSMVSGNTSDTFGGGIYTQTGNVTLTGSAISDNSGVAAGGAITTRSGDVNLTNSTLSSNSSSALGGGILMRFGGSLNLTNSTVSGNETTGPGGGISSPFSPILSITNSIVAGNTDDGTAPDLHPDPDGTLVINDSLIGVADNLGPISGGTNQTGTAAIPLDPLLASLADNGGPTQTRALLPGSPAIDMGDPNFVGPPDYDQRGFAFERIVGGRIDIGAFETGATSADFDTDGDVDGRDFLTWQHGFGGAPVVHADGDANVDGAVDAIDLTVWENSFGNTLTPLAAGAVGSEQSVVAVQLTAALAVTDTEFFDAALAMHWLPDNSVGEKLPAAEEPSKFDSAFDSAFEISVDSSALLPPISTTAVVGAPTTFAAEVEAPGEPWLAEELLERVFG